MTWPCGEIAELLQRFCDAQSRGERVSNSILARAREVVVELTTEPTAEDLAGAAAFGARIAVGTIRKIGEMRAARQ